jgi:hypothetical protein
LYKQIVEQYYKSQQRINENNELAKKDETADEEDGEVDKDELEAIREENKNEYDLQLSIAELIGVLFKTHPQLSSSIVQDLFNTLLRESLES